MEGLMKFSLRFSLIFLIPIFVFAKSKIDVPYEQLGVFKHSNFRCVFIYTTAKDRGSLLKIVTVYKKRYSSMAAFQIYFFNNREKGKVGTPWLRDVMGDLSNEENSCLIANYSHNKGTGFDQLLDTFGGSPDTQMAK